MFYQNIYTGSLYAELTKSVHINGSLFTVCVGLISKWSICTDSPCAGLNMLVMLNITLILYGNLTIINLNFLNQFSGILICERNSFINESFNSLFFHAGLMRVYHNDTIKFCVRHRWKTKFTINHNAHFQVCVEEAAGSAVPSHIRSADSGRDPTGGAYDIWNLSQQAE